MTISRTDPFMNSVNPQSIALNKEFGGEIYKDPSSGEYAATTPVEGTDAGVDPHNTSRPNNSKLVGDYHCHGDYSTKDPKTGAAVRSSDPKKDDFNSDNFSSADKNGITADAKIYGAGYKGYLGTPSGTFLQYDPSTGTTTPIK